MSYVLRALLVLLAIAYTARFIVTQLEPVVPLLIVLAVLLLLWRLLRARL